ncbi:DUF3306 domain-containing protein [Azospirillum thermophilum]|uniref:DUF3306 domain-containing protein n=1 Tax=Azospirillum thermophilum TaxID=2202148 RepID=A0A2S2CKJ6_9PROT|nr:DUF3306 domain-containing protein [Azospirillum thermophilum]AWK84890.1 DUF3306 domain-containing protein [Azospirillum thermophilum]
MADRESFLDRWSRLKRGTATPAAGGPAREEPAGESAAPPPEEEEEAASVLPPLDSLGADSDYSAFLGERVPEELRRLALRKAWSSDPKIAEFRGFAEYDWDFNAPGYGSLLPTDDIARLLDRVFPDQPAQEVAEEEAPEEADQTAGGTAAEPAAIEDPPAALPSPGPDGEIVTASADRHSPPPPDPSHSR